MVLSVTLPRWSYDVTDELSLVSLDHGYIMDVGNASVRGFLPSKVAAKLSHTLTVGSVLLAQVRLN
jgi:hypothetical protein